MTVRIVTAPDLYDSAYLRHHVGDAGEPLRRWCAALTGAWKRGWGSVKVYAPDVMELIADSRVLYVAAHELRKKGSRGTVPGDIRLERLSDQDIRTLCEVLGGLIATETYRPGVEERIRIPKPSGKTRTILLTSWSDRIVQKAASLVLRPMLDPLFDPRSFASRPKRKLEEAIAVARTLTRNGHPIWLAHDIADAYGSVGVERLLDVFFKLLPCRRLRDLLGLVLPPRTRGIGGIKQGGPLSPLALEVYLNHFLDKPFRKAGFGVCLVRYVDDLLVPCPNSEVAGEVDRWLRRQLEPAGMALKANFAEAQHDLRVESAEWLGFRCNLKGDRFGIRLGVGAFDGLGQSFLRSHAKGQPAANAARVANLWTGRLGPCHRWEDRDAVCDRIEATARRYDFEESICKGDMLEAWSTSKAAWKQTLVSVKKRPAFFDPNPVAIPTPTSVIA